MPKKKTQVNGFYMFMLELRPKLEKEGRSFPNGFADVATVANPRWQKLPPEERERYNNQAKAEKNSASNKSKLNSEGRCIAEIEKNISEEKNIIKNMKKSILNWIERLPSVEATSKEKFYFISFNIVCQILVENSDNELINVPNEVGIVEYSIEKGISRVYHKFIEPGQLPMGYAFEAKQHSENTHQIPAYGFEEADSNYLGIWIEMKNFINQDELKDVYPAFFSSSDQVSQSKGCIQWLYERSMEPRKKMLKVFDINILLMELRAKVDQPLNSENEAQRLLSKNTFDYTSDICCYWHEEKGCPDCSLAVVRKLAYLMSDVLCHHYNVELTNKHIPELQDHSEVTFDTYSQNRQYYDNRLYEASNSQTYAYGNQSQPSNYRSIETTMEDLTSQTSTVDEDNNDNASFASHQEMEDQWNVIGRGKSSKKMSSDQNPRRPGQGRPLRFGIGRGNFKHQ